MIDHITGMEPDNPDPAQLDLLSCFFDHADISQTTVSPGEEAAVEINTRDPTLCTTEVNSLNNEQMEFARVLREKSIALASRKRDPDDDE